MSDEFDSAIGCLAMFGFGACVLVLMWLARPTCPPGQVLVKGAGYEYVCVAGSYPKR